jgi:hypothetical protein
MIENEEIAKKLENESFQKYLQWLAVEIKKTDNLGIVYSHLYALAGTSISFYLGEIK